MRFTARDILNMTTTGFRERAKAEWRSLNEDGLGMQLEDYGVAVTPDIGLNDLESALGAVLVFRYESVGDVAVYFRSETAEVIAVGDGSNHKGVTRHNNHGIYIVELGKIRVMDFTQESENARRSAVEASTRCSCRDDLADPDRKRKCERHGVLPWLKMTWPCGKRVP